MASRALIEVSFDVRAREVLGLIGPNGAGKTTRLETIAGILPVDAATCFGTREWRWRYSEVEQLGRLEVEHELELDGLARPEGRWASRP